MLHSCLREMNGNVEMSTWMELIISNLIKICFFGHQQQHSALQQGEWDVYTCKHGTA